MTTSEEMEAIALWMMIVGGGVSVFGIGAIVLSADGLGRGDLSKPLTIIGICLFLLGGFLKYRWGIY